VLGGAVSALQNEGHAAQDRGDVDDPAAAPGAHGGQEGLGHAHQAEDVGLELAAHLLVGHQGHGGERAIAGVVHQHVQAVALGAALDLGGGGLDGGAVVDVKLEGLQGQVAGLFLQGLQGVWLAAGGEHTVALPCQGEGRFLSDAGGCAGDEDDLFGWGHGESRLASQAAAVDSITTWCRQYSR